MPIPGKPWPVLGMIIDLAPACKLPGQVRRAVSVARRACAVALARGEQLEPQLLRRVTQFPPHRWPENTHHDSRRSSHAQHATVRISSAMGSARRARAVSRVPRVPNLLSPTRRPCQATAMQPPRLWDSRWELPPRCSGERNCRHRLCNNHGASSPPRSM